LSELLAHWFWLLKLWVYTPFIAFWTLSVMCACVCVYKCVSFLPFEQIIQFMSWLYEIFAKIHTHNTHTQSPTFCWHLSGDCQRLSDIWQFRALWTPFQYTPFGQQQLLPLPPFHYRFCAQGCCYCLMQPSRNIATDSPFGAVNKFFPIYCEFYLYLLLVFGRQKCANLFLSINYRCSPSPFPCVYLKEI